MLKLTYDLEKENKKFYLEENEVLKTQCDAYAKRVEASRRQAEQKERELLELKTSGFRTGAIKDKLPVDMGEAMRTAPVEDDMFSEFSQETGLKPEENQLDLAIDNCDFYGEYLSQVLDVSELTPKNFLTFITVEFYDHDTKATDVMDGFKPEFAT